MTTMQQPIEIIRYTAEHKAEWDSIVAASRNGTFIHLRDYMDYHADRFCDHSLMFYRNREPIALLPAHIADDTIYSHNGLTYGGLLLTDAATTDTILELFERLREYLLHTTTVTKFIYKPVPHIYHSYPCEEELYALFRNSAVLTERKISSAIKLDRALPFKGRRKLTTAMKMRLHIVEDNDFATFWEILDSRLKSKYGVAPVHSLDEIMRLHNCLPDNIRLFRITDDNGETLGGTVIYVTDTVAHMQYSGTTEEGRRTSALDYLYEYLIAERFADKEYFDFGISVEEGGKVLNSGLIAYKERLGGRGIMYDTYTIDLKSNCE